MDWRQRHAARVKALEQAAASMLLRAVGTIIDTIAADLGTITAAAGDGEAQVNPDDLAAIQTQWAAAVHDTVVPWYANVYRAGADAAVEQIQALGIDVPAVDPLLVDTAAASYLAQAEQRFTSLGADVWAEARAGLTAGFVEGEGIDSLRRRVQSATGMARAAAEAVARTEVIAASNLGAQQRVAMMGEDAPQFKQWLATMDDRTRPTHAAADGQVVPRTQPFAVGASHLQVPGDPTGPAGEVINCRCTTIYTDDPSGEIAGVAGRGQGGVVDYVSEALVAATTPPSGAPNGPPQYDSTTGEPHDGSMIALVPADPEAYVQAGGEPADALHVTLAYLGDATAMPDGLPDALQSLVGEIATVIAPVDARIFGTAVWNTTGDTPCLVASVGGEGLDDAHAMAWAAADLAAYHVLDQSADDFYPDQHAPWCAHMCLAYTAMPVTGVPAAMALEGPLLLDTLRLTFGADAYDYPLTGQPTEEAPMTATARPIININLGAGADPKALGSAVAAALADRVPTFARGGIVPGPTTVSVDAIGGVLTAAAPTGAPTGQPMPPEGYQGPPAMAGEHLWTVMHTEGESTGFRTFTNLSYRQPPFAYHWSKTSSAHGGEPEVVQVGNVVRVVQQGSTFYGFVTLDLASYDGGEYARRVVGGFDRWVSIGLDETPTKETIIWPAEPPPEPFIPGEALPTEEEVIKPEQVIIDGGRIGELTAVSVPAQADAFAGPTQELFDLLPGAQTSIPVDTAQVLAASAADTQTCRCGGSCGHCAPTPADMVEAVTAAAASIQIQDLPPGWWYDAPHDMAQNGRLPGAFNVTDEGRIYGLLAPLGTGHRAFVNARRQETPWGNVDYGRFMGAWALTADGQRHAGPLTMDCGHAPRLRANGDVGPAHYDNACSIIGAVAVGEDRDLGGVWMAGALLPGVAPAQVARALACRCSGDWQPHPDKAGWTELIACLLVPSPGFGSAHPEGASVTMDQGVLVASAVPVQHVATRPVSHPYASAVTHLTRSPAQRIIEATS